MGHLVPLRLAATGLIALAASSCSYLPWVSSSDWEVVTTPRITAYANQSQGDGSRAAVLALEQAYALLNSSVFATKPIAPVEALFVDWPEFRRVLGPTRTQAAIGKLPGKTIYGKRGLIVMYGRDTSLAGATHRLSHLFLHALAPRAPLWLHEGLAGYLEKGAYKEGGGTDVTVCLGQAPPKAPAVPLEELFALSFVDFDASAKASDYRLAAGHVVDYFMMAEGGKLRDPFLNFIGELAETGDTTAALAKTFAGMTPKTLEEKLAAFDKASAKLVRGLCPIAYPVPSDRVPDTAAPKATTDVQETIRENVDRLFTAIRMLPRRGGQADWFPPDMIGVEGGQFEAPPPPPPEKKPTKRTGKKAAPGSKAKPPDAGSTPSKTAPAGEMMPTTGPLPAPAPSKPPADAGVAAPDAHKSQGAR